MFVLIAFNHELARAREVASVPMLALIRLQWWREVVEGARRKHEVAAPLRDAIEAGFLNDADLLAMIDAREIEVEDTVPDLAAWNALVEGTAGGFAVAAGRMLGAGEADLARLRSLGAAYGVAGQIASVPALAQRERCLLPADVLGGHGLTPYDVMARPDRAEPVVADLARMALERMAKARGAFARTIVAAALPGVLARRDLRRGQRIRRFSDRFAVTVAGLTGWI
jgi:phytoene synthase